MNDILFDANVSHHMPQPLVSNIIKSLFFFNTVDEVVILYQDVTVLLPGLKSACSSLFERSLLKAFLWSSKSRMSFVTHSYFFFFFPHSTSWTVHSITTLMFLVRVSTSQSIKLKLSGHAVSLNQSKFVGCLNRTSSTTLTSS